MYRISTQKSLDIDWFVYLQNTPIHIASNGGFIPRNTYKVRELNDIYNHVMSMPENNDVEVNESYIKNLDGYEYLENRDYSTVFNEESSDGINKVELYSESFVSMAKRGFCSFDRIDSVSPRGYELYRLIAWPKKSKYENLIFCKDDNVPLVRIIQLMLSKNGVGYSKNGILELNCEVIDFLKLIRKNNVTDYFKRHSLNNP